MVSRIISKTFLSFFRGIKRRVENSNSIQLWRRCVIPKRYFIQSWMRFRTWGHFCQTYSRSILINCYRVNPVSDNVFTASRRLSLRSMLYTSSRLFKLPILTEVIYTIVNPYRELLRYYFQQLRVVTRFSSPVFYFTIFFQRGLWEDWRYLLSVKRVEIINSTFFSFTCEPQVFFFFFGLARNWAFRFA